MTGAGRRLIRSLQTAVPESKQGVVVLCYHLVGAATGGPVDVPLEVFEGHVKELAHGARVIGLEDLESSLENDDGSGKPTVIVTFDDAYSNFFDKAWPLLAEHGFPATLFVPIGFVNREGPIPSRSVEGLPPARWSEIREAVDSGLLTVGSHSWSHADIRTLDGVEAQRELGDSRAELEARLGVEVRSFCYPRGLWNSRAMKLVGEHYELAFVGGGQRVTRGSFSALRIPRTPLRRDNPPSIGPILGCRVWLEEWFADKVRRALR